MAAPIATEKDRTTRARVFFICDISSCMGPSKGTKGTRQPAGELDDDGRAMNGRTVFDELHGVTVAQPARGSMWP